MYNDVPKKLVRVKRQSFGLIVAKAVPALNSGQN